MHKLEDIAERIRQNFDVRTSKRDEALKQARQLTRACSLAIRAVHRDDKEAMEANLAEAQTLADILRSGYSQEAERLLGIMDEIYSVLVTMDYPDAITYGLRRQTDLVRGIIE